LTSLEIDSYMYSGMFTENTRLTHTCTAVCLQRTEDDNVIFSRSWI